MSHGIRLAASLFLAALVFQKDAPEKPPAKEKAARTDLYGDPLPPGAIAVWRMAAAPKQSVPFMKQQLHPVAEPGRNRIDKLIADLDDNRFAVREKAAKELEKLADLAEPALHKALESKPSLEVRRRLE